MEHQRKSDGSISELPPAVLDCGHPNGPRLSLVGFEWSPEHGRRTRTFYCRTCGRVTFVG